jgi:hypothetical protein
MKVVRLSALRTDRLYPQEWFLALVSIRGWVDSRAILGQNGFNSVKNPNDPIGIFFVFSSTLYVIRTWYFVLIVLALPFCPYCTTQTFLPPAGYEPAIPASKRPQVHALDHAVTGIGGIKPSTFRIVAQCLTRLRHRVPPLLQHSAQLMQQKYHHFFRVYCLSSKKCIEMNSK